MYETRYPTVKYSKIDLKLPDDQSNKFEFVKFRIGQDQNVRLHHLKIKNNLFYYVNRTYVLSTPVYTEKKLIAFCLKVLKDLKAF